jgi:hypothetical protein
MQKLTYQISPVVYLATNKFVNVPVILKFDDVPLISIIRENSLCFKTKIPIYHSDGTYLAKVNGTQVFKTPDGEKAGIVMRQLPGITVCEMDGKTLFEIRHQPGDTFRTNAEIYTPTGYFVKSTDPLPPQIIDASGKALKVGGLTMSNSVIQGFKVGIWLKSDGNCSIGCN